MNQLRRPLVVALLTFLPGLVLSLRFVLHPVAVWLIFFVSLALAFGRRKGSQLLGLGSDRLTLLALFAASGFVVGSLERREKASDCRSLISDGQQVELVGWLGAAHRLGAAGSGAPLLPLLPDSMIDPAGCGGEIRLRMPPDQAEIAAGTFLHVRGEWRTFALPVNHTPWPRDPRYLGFVRADSVSLETGEEASARPWLAGRARVDAALATLFPRNLALVEALLLGRGEYVDDAVQKRFADAGLTHLLAISGSHVGLFAVAIILVGSAIRLSRPYAILLTLAAVWSYLAIIGAPASALRAGVMLTIGLLASLLQRPSAAGPIIAAAAFVILAFSPLAVLEPGFQLSFLGVLGMLFLRKPLLAVIPGAWQRRGWRRVLTDATVIGIAAFAATAPVVAHHFGVIAPISIPIGIPAVPLTSLALIGVISALALHPIVPPLAQLLADGTGLAMDLLDSLAAFAAAVPLGHFPVPKPPWWTWTIAVGTGALTLKLTPRAKTRRVLSSGAAIAVIVIWPLGSRAATDGLEIHFIDVGQGDAIAIRTPGARWILVDAGPVSNGFDAGERRVLPFLRNHGVNRIEALVLTHPHLDHIGGAVAILRGLPVNYLFEPGVAAGSEPYLDLIRAIESQTTDWRAARSGRSIELDGVRFDFLWPDAEMVDAVEDANQISAVLLVSYGEFSALLTGDAGAEVETILVRRLGPTLRSEVLKLGHHGSTTSTSQLFLETVDPDLAVISSGRRNRFGHPAPAVVSEVESRHIPIARTDREGTVSVRVEPGGREWTRLEW